MIATLRKVEVELGGVSVQLGRPGRREGESPEVNTVTDGVIIWMRILLEDRQDCRIRSRSQGARTNISAIGIHARKLLRGQIHSLRRIVTVGRCSCAASEIANASIAKIIAGHNAGNLEVLGAALAFVSRKEENAILLDGAADSSTEGVPNQMRRPVGKA